MREQSKSNESRHAKHRTDNGQLELQFLAEFEKRGAERKYVHVEDIGVVK